MKHKVLITGATGFIGGRIVERMYFAGRRDFLAGIHNWSSAARIGRFPVDMEPCNLMVPSQLEKALNDVAIVIHCAVGNREVIVDGTKRLLEEALKRHVKHFIHISTVDVYGDVQGKVDESFPLVFSANSYGNMKIEAEMLCSEYFRLGLPVTILRPTVVYGPFSNLWTLRLANRLLSGNWGIFEGYGGGVCNLLYVDDLVSVILNVINNKNSAGEAFNISGPETVTWNDYFEMFNLSLGLPALNLITSSNSRANSTVVEPVRKVSKYLLDHFGRQVMGAYEKYPIAQKLMKSIEQRVKTTPNSDELNLYKRTAKYSYDKARVRLGYKPEFTIDRGLGLTQEWLRHHGIIQT